MCVMKVQRCSRVYISVAFPEGCKAVASSLALFLSRFVALSCIVSLQFGTKMQCAMSRNAPCCCSQPSQATHVPMFAHTASFKSRTQHPLSSQCTEYIIQPTWSSAQLSRPAAVARHQQGLPVRRGDHCRGRAGPIDAAPTWTLDQIAGLAFGVLMVVFYFSANAVDVWVAKQQRRELGLCEECGGVYDAATCTKANCPMKAKANQR